MYAFAQHLKNRLYLRVILVTVVLAVLMMSIQHISTHLLTFEGLAVLLGCGLLYGVSQRISGSILEGNWTGYPAIAITIAWMSADLDMALLIIVGLTLVNSLIDRYLHQHQGTILYKTGAQIAINGTHAIVGFLIYTLLFNRVTPAIVTNFSEYVPLAGALVGGAAAALTVGMLYTGRIPHLSREQAVRMVSLDTLLGILTPVLPLILTRIGAIAFLIVMGLLTAQALRYYQVSDARQALLQRIREMGAVDTLSTAISDELDTKSLLRDIYGVLQPIINFETLFIALYDPATQKIDYASVIHDGQPVTWQPRQLRSGLTDYIIRQQESLLINRNQRHQFEQLNIEPDDVTSAAYAGVPMKINGKFMGVMGVLHTSDADAFDNDTVMILRAVASQTGLAVRNAALYERNVTLADSLNLINSSLQSIMFNLDRDSAMDHAVKIAAEIAGTDIAAIYLVDCGGTCLKAHHQIGFDPVDLEQTIPFRPDQFPDGSLVINDVEDNPNLEYAGSVMAAGFRSAVEVPLQSGNTLIGCLAVYSDQPRIYPHHVVQMMELIASQITAALDNAELLEALELYAAEQAQLVHLARISTSSLDLNRLLQDVSDMLAQMFSMQQVIVGLANADNHRMSYVTPVGGELPPLITGDVVRQITEFEAALSQTKPQVHTYSLSDELSPSLHRLMADNQVNTLVVMPLINNQNLTGVIIMWASHPVNMSDNERRMLEMASHQISTQMQNARIYELTEESLVRRLEELSLLEDIAQKITQTLEIDSLIDNVLEASMQATQAEFASIALLNTENNQFDIIQHELIDGVPFRSRDTKSLEDGVIGYVARTGKSQIIPDNDTVDYYIRANENVYRSSLAVPLATTGGIIGVLNLESRQRDFFTEQDAAFVISLSGHAAISIANANLLEEREYQIQTLTHLRRLTLDASAATNQREVTRAILQIAMDMTNGSEVALYHYSRSAGEIVLMSALRWNRDFLIEAYPRLPDAILYEVARRGIMEIVDDTSESRFYTDSTEFAALDHRSALIAPVRRRGEVHEVLCILFAEPRHFAMREVNTVELLAAQAASHLENAELNAALRTSIDQMRAILDANHDGIILLDHTGRVMDSNVAAADILGIALDQHLDEPLVNLLLERARKSDTASREELENMARLYRLDPQRVTGRDYTLDRDGNPIHIREIGTPVTDHENRTIGRLLLLRDITEEYELNQYRNKIQSMVLHDLRGPLSSIISSMYLGLTVIERDDKDARESLQTTLEVSLESAKNLLTLVESLRDIPRLEQGQIKLKRTHHSLREICEKAYESLAASLRDSNQEVIIDIPEELDTVYVDENMMRRVFINLLHNAYKFSPSDEPILIRAENSEQPDILRVLVCDHGPGIPPEMRQRIFTEFEQIAELRPHRGGRGSGLGLTFCKLALDAHGGDIFVAKQGPTKGACFTLLLPGAPKMLTPEK